MGDFLESVDALCWLIFVSLTEFKKIKELYVRITA